MFKAEMIAPCGLDCNICSQALIEQNPCQGCKGPNDHKNIYLFATSGGSGIGKTAEKLALYIKGGTLADAKKVGNVAELKEWI